MHIPVETWEPRLLSLAAEAVKAATTAVSHHQPAPQDAHLLQRAYTHCEKITAVHSRSFHLASALMPRQKQLAVRALYAFCRTTDDIVDYPTDDVQLRLAQWHQHAFSHQPPEEDLVAVAWANARTRYHVPLRYAEQLVEGVQRDLYQTRYATFDELATYCYGVASTVGLMSMYIIGFQQEDAIPYAIKLGLALQMTNILRDVGEDWQRGRLYLPQDELAAYGLSETDIANGRVDERWRAFMRFQIARNRQLYAESQPGIGLLNKDGRFAIAAAAGLYQAILQDIEKHDYDVFSRRAHVTGWGKIRRLPGLWWHSTAVSPKS